MKSFERQVMAYLKFAFRVKRSVDDAVNMALQYILQHLSKPGNCTRILFVDLSSALNSMVPNLLSDKLPTLMCQWIINFLTGRQQLVRLGKLKSRTLTISTGAPQGCVLSPLLFSLYTRGAQPCSWRLTFLQSSAPTLIKHT
ncbi:putative RNA-directed DNA polymerase from transposon BS [Labeo rohita]|uniref:RNA-directed DNA polymerase from transposon BS n=1 Tax=Labeo rohita TaxID=84645 RepID=A0ABQ8LF13_LABRO|nr:putative RNA-directed DNA polymerase from transposon BS [Labeo rohita]